MLSAVDDENDDDEVGQRREQPPLYISPFAKPTYGINPQTGPSLIASAQEWAMFRPNSLPMSITTNVK